MKVITRIYPSGRHEMAAQRGMRRCCLVLALIGCAGAQPPAPQHALPAALTAPGATILIGDFHGTREIPPFVGDLVTQLATDHPVVVALEIPASETPSFEGFLASDGSAAAHAALLGDPWWRDPVYQDGRRSVAMAELVERLRRLHVAVARIDAAMLDSRDQMMANNVLAVRAAHPGATLVVFAGNLHTRRNGYPEMPGTTFMAGFLRQAGLPFIALDTRYERGTAWSCSTGGHCGAAKFRGQRSARGLHMEPDQDGNYDGWYGVGAISSSPPAYLQ
jgi:hypothetical protein